MTLKKACILLASVARPLTLLFQVGTVPKGRTITPNTLLLEQTEVFV